MTRTPRPYLRSVKSSGARPSQQTPHTKPASNHIKIINAPDNGPLPRLTRFAAKLLLDIYRLALETLAREIPGFGIDGTVTIEIDQALLAPNVIPAFERALSSHGHALKNLLSDPNREAVLDQSEPSNIIPVGRTMATGTPPSNDRIDGLALTYRKHNDGVSVELFTKSGSDSNIRRTSIVPERIIPYI